MGRHLLLAITNLAVLAGGVVGVVVLGPEPLLGSDECRTQPLVSAEDSWVAQPFAFIDLLAVDWEGNEESFEVHLAVAGSFPEASTDVTGPVVATSTFSSGDASRVFTATLDDQEWRVDITNGEGVSVVPAEHVAVDVDGEELTISAPAGAMAGLQAAGASVSWRSDVATPDAVTPAALPARTDVCATAWDDGDETAPGEVPDGQQDMDLVDTRSGRLRVSVRQPCRSIAAVWAASVDESIDELVAADDGQDLHDVLASEVSVTLATTTSQAAANACPDLVELALAHLRAADIVSTFTFTTDEIDDLDCGRVAEVRDELANFTYVTAADYAGGLEAATLAERERHRNRCGDPLDQITVPGVAADPTAMLGDNRDFWELEQDDCVVMDFDEDSTEFLEPRVVPCTRPHDFQVDQAFEIPDSLGHNTRQFIEHVFEQCVRDGLTDQLLHDDDYKYLFVTPVWPTEFGWEIGDRWGLCVLSDIDGFRLVDDLVDESADTTST